MLTIKDLSVSNELDVREMSAVRGALCVDVNQSLNEAVKDSGAYGLIVAAGTCLEMINKGLPVCPA